MSIERTIPIPDDELTSVALPRNIRLRLKNVSGSHAWYLVLPAAEAPEASEFKNRTDVRKVAPGKTFGMLLTDGEQLWWLTQDAGASVIVRPDFDTENHRYWC